METPKDRKPYIGANLVVKKRKREKSHTGANLIIEGRPKEKEMNKRKLQLKINWGKFLKISKDEWNDRRPKKKRREKRKEK